MTGRTGAARVARLEECAEVLPGFSVHGRMEHDPHGTHQLVLTRHLTDGVPYVFDPSHELRIAPTGKTERYEIHSGDVLFMSRGSRNRAWEVQSVAKHTIAPVSLFIIRPANDMDAGYLAWYLNQPPAQTSIDQIRTGAGAPIVQRSAFAQIEILVPPLDVQRKIAELGTLLAREQELMGRLTDMVTRSHAAIGQQLIIQMRPGDSAQERSR